jgi:hypothetical protein
VVLAAGTYVSSYYNSNKCLDHARACKNVLPTSRYRTVQHGPSPLEHFHSALDDTLVVCSEVFARYLLENCVEDFWE